MSLLLRLLDTDSISLKVYGFWGSLRRSIGRALPDQLTNWWTKHIRTIYAPQHSNLRAAIPKTWCDLDGCVESFLFACVIAFVEDEDGLDDWEGQPEVLEWFDGPNPHRQQAAMLREVYNWAKTGRAAAEDEWYAASPKITFDEFVAGKGEFTRVHQLTEETEAKTQRYLLWVVTNRRLMWT